MTTVQQNSFLDLLYAQISHQPEEPKESNEPNEPLPNEPNQLILLGHVVHLVDLVEPNEPNEPNQTKSTKSSSSGDVKLASLAFNFSSCSAGPKTHRTVPSSRTLRVISLVSIPCIPGTS